MCSTDWEPRHQQDFVRGHADRQRVSEPRPVAPDTFVNTSFEMLYAADGEQLFASGGTDELLASG